MPLEYLGIDFNTRRELHRDPTWPAARKAIELLDGSSVSMVRLSTLAGTSLSIGGGEAGQYVVSGIHSNGAATALLDPQSAGPAVGVRNGRSLGLFPSQMVVSKALVLRAAELFWRNGNFDTTLSWQASGARSERPEAVALP